MAEWRKVAKAFALGDGHISEKEVKVLETALLVDGKVSQSELDFLLEVKAESKTSVQLLDTLIEKVKSVKDSE